jgi:hypothetical protein
MATCNLLYHLNQRKLVVAALSIPVLFSFELLLSEFPYAECLKSSRTQSLEIYFSVMTNDRHPWLHATHAGNVAEDCCLMPQSRDFGSARVEGRKCESVDNDSSAGTEGRSVAGLL